MSNWPPQTPSNFSPPGAPLPGNHLHEGGQYAGIYAGQPMVSGGGPAPAHQQQVYPGNHLHAQHPGLVYPQTFHPVGAAAAQPQFHQVQQPLAVADVSGNARYRTRLRWENIFPLFTVIALVVAGILFVRSSEPTGESTGPSRDARSISSPAGDTKMSAGDVTAKLAQVDTLISKGQYSEAGMILQAMAGMSGTYPEIAAAQARLDRTEAQDARLTRKLGEYVGKGQWRAARRTIRQIAALHPLTASQQQILDRANKEIAQARKARSSEDHAQDPSASRGDSSDSGHSSSNSGTTHHHQGFPDTSSSSNAKPPKQSSGQAPPPSTPPPAPGGSNIPTPVA